MESSSTLFNSYFALTDILGYKSAYIEYILLGQTCVFYIHSYLTVTFVTEAMGIANALLKKDSHQRTVRFYIDVVLIHSLCCLVLNQLWAQNSVYFSY